MAIGTTAAILGSAAISAGAGALSASKNSKAINAATDAQTQSNAQTLALQKQIYDQNVSRAQPFYQTGLSATNQINALLGLGGQQQQQQPAQQQVQPNALAQFMGGTNVPQANQFDNPFAGQGGDFPALSDLGKQGSFLNPFLQRAFQQTVGNPTPQPMQQQPKTVNAQPTQQSAQDAFQAFRDSTGYQFRLGQGYDAINSGYAANGTLQSGAANKALLEYGQNFASNEFGNWFNMLNNQQGVGLSANNALNGVSTNYAANVGNINASNANALGNAAIAKANNSNALIGGIAGSIGGALGGLGGSSYGSQFGLFG